MEIVQKELHEIAIASNYLELCEQEKAIKEQKSIADYKMKKIMEKYGIKSMSDDYMTVTYVPEHESTTLDREAMEREGILLAFQKPTIVKSSLRVKLK